MFKMFFILCHKKSHNKSVFSFVYTSGSFIMKLPIYSIYIWSWRRDSNPWPADYETATLPTELLQHMLRKNMVILPLSSSHRLSDRQGLSCGANRIGRYYPWRFFIWHWSTYAIRPVPWRSASKVHWRDGAGGRIWTLNRLITNQLLYQLSYTSIWIWRIVCTYVYLSVCVFVFI